MLRYIIKHKEGIVGTLLVHLIALMVFNIVTLKEIPRELDGLVIDFSEELVEEKTEQEEEAKKEQENQSAESQSSADNARNIARNEAAPRMLNAQEYNKIGKSVSQTAKERYEEKLMEDLKKIEEDVLNEQRASGYGYTPEQAQKLIDSKKQPELDKVPVQEARSEGAFKGETNISYKLENRYDTYIYVPVYLCQNGGVVVVNIVVNPNGNVLSAKIDEESTRTSDACLREAALKAAQSTRFNANKDSPAAQKGNMTFRFVEQ